MSRRLAAWLWVHWLFGASRQLPRITSGYPCPVSGLFAVDGRLLVAQLALPPAWAGDVAGSLEVIDHLAPKVAIRSREGPA